MKEEEFIRNQIDFQMRGVIGRKISFSPEKINFIAERRSNFFFGYDFGMKKISIRGEDFVKLSDLENNVKYQSLFSHPRFRWVISHFSRVFDKGIHYFDFNDGVPGTDLASEEGILPVFQYNRYNSAVGAILWPLAYYHDIGNDNFVGSAFKDNIPFEEKKGAIVWRGSIRGKNTDGDNCVNILKLLDKNAISKEMAYEKMMGISRFRAVEQFFGANFVNFGIVSNDIYTGRHDFYGDRRSNRLSKAEICSYKYLLSLEGGDVATNFIWGANTNSIVFKQEYPWEVFYDAHFLPWIHYIPIKYDLSDLEEQFYFCEKNPALCREIINNAALLCKMISNRRLRKSALDGIIDLYKKSLFYKIL